MVPFSKSCTWNVIRAPALSKKVMFFHSTMKVRFGAVPTVVVEMDDDPSATRSSQNTKIESNGAEGSPGGRLMWAVASAPLPKLRNPFVDTATVLFVVP